MLLIWAYDFWVTISPSTLLGLRHTQTFSIWSVNICDWNPWTRWSFRSSPAVIFHDSRAWAGTKNLILFRILSSDKAAFWTVPSHTWLFSLKAESHFAVSIRTYSYYGEDITKNRHLAIKIQFVWMPRALTLQGPCNHFPQNRGRHEPSPNHIKASATQHPMGPNKLNIFKAVHSGLCGLPWLLAI